MFILYTTCVTSWLIGCVLCLYILRRYYCYTNDRIWKYTAHIKGPLAFPLIGHSYLALGGTNKILEKVNYYAEKYQPMIKIWVGSRCYIFVTRPEDIQVVLNKSLERENGYKYLIPVFGDGLFTKPVEEWKLHRKTIASTFNQPVLNSFTESYNKYTRIMIEKLRQYAGRDDFVNIFPPLSYLAIDILCSTVMGTEMNAMEEESPFCLWQTRTSELAILRMFKVHLWPDCIWKLTSMCKESADLDRKIRNYVKSIIKNKRYSKKPNTEEKKIFLDHLLELTDKEGAWSDEELTNETRSVIMAGSDATALTLSYCFVMLGMFQDQQDKVYKELSSVYDNTDRYVTADDLPHLDYLDRFIKETLRLFPVASNIARESVQDITLRDCTLPKGISIGIPILHLHRNPRFWKDPLKFDPDRFLPEEVAMRHPCCYLPFSYGPRNCIGFKYASMALKVILANILRYYKVTATSYKNITDLELKMDIATKLANGYNVRLDLRKGNKKLSI